MKKVLLAIFCLLVPVAQAGTVYLTRHYEKAKGDDPSLTADGAARASQLAAYFTTTPLQHIYSTSYRRTQETVAPLAQQQGLTVEDYDPSDLSAFADLLRQQTGFVLVSGHSNTTPVLIQLLGGPDVSIGEDDYGTLYILKTDDQGTVMQTIEIFP